MSSTPCRVTTNAFYHLAQLPVVDADDGRADDIGVLHDPVLDLDRVDVLAAPDDEVPRRCRW